VAIREKKRKERKKVKRGKSPYPKREPKEPVVLLPSRIFLPKEEAKTGKEREKEKEKERERATKTRKGRKQSSERKETKESKTQRKE
jgi:hypothetical protein